MQTEQGKGRGKNHKTPKKKKKKKNHQPKMLGQSDGEKKGTGKGGLTVRSYRKQNIEVNLHGGGRGTGTGTSGGKSQKGYPTLVGN